MKYGVRMYNEVMDFCRKQGLIERLTQSFSISESEHFNALHVEKSGLDVLDAVHCLYDSRRTAFFLEEIHRQVSRGDVVLEAGIGTGILSFYAASLGAKVFGCEINPAVFSLAQNIKGHLERNGFISDSSIEFFLHDATSFVPPQSVDVLISENMYTGMFFEYQVQIANNLLAYVKSDGISIPQKICSFFSLAEARFPHEPVDKELFVPLPGRGREVPYTFLSAPVHFDEINFSQKSSEILDLNNVVTTQKAGSINGLVMYSEVVMPSGKTIGKDDTEFLNNEIIIAVCPGIHVKKGDVIQYSLRYTYGCKPEEARLKLRKLS